MADSSTSDRKPDQPSDRKPGRVARTVTRARQRSELVDHAFRTKERYSSVIGSRLAAANAYYGFFAVFALAVAGFSVLGFLIEARPALEQQVTDYLEENLPVVDTQQITAGRGTAGVFGLLGALLTGLAWVGALRSSQRLVWQLEQQPGNVIKRRLADLLALLLLVLVLGISIGATAVIGYLLEALPLAWVGGWVLLIAVNLVLAVGLLAILPRLRVTWRRLLPPALVVAIGLVVLNTVGQFYFQRVQENPAYAVVATAAGLLVYLYVVHQLLLWSAAWTATGAHGRVVDLATGSPAGE